MSCFRFRNGVRHCHKYEMTPSGHRANHLLPWAGAKPVSFSESPRRANRKSSFSATAMLESRQLDAAPGQSSLILYSISAAFGCTVPSRVTWLRTRTLVARLAATTCTSCPAVPRRRIPAEVVQRSGAASTGDVAPSTRIGARHQLEFHYLGDMVAPTRLAPALNRLDLAAKAWFFACGRCT